MALPPDRHNRIDQRPLRALALLLARQAAADHWARIPHAFAMRALAPDSDRWCPNSVPAAIATGTSTAT